MALLGNDRYLDALAGQSALFAEALVGADPRQRVPTCPDWTLLQLTAHLAEVHRWATAIVTRPNATTPPDRSGLDATGAPEDAAGLSMWFRDGADALVEAIRAADPQTPVWGWAGDHSVGFWTRRMAHETAVHRADAELALGREFTLEADLAADAISEWLGFVSLPQAAQYRPELAELRGQGEILHLHSTDQGLGEAGEWIVRRTPSGPVWEHGHAKGDVAVRGPVVYLLLVLMRRIPPSDAPIDVLGDAGVLEHWLAHAPF